jgi:hypothetical protein
MAHPTVPPSGSPADERVRVDRKLWYARTRMLDRLEELTRRVSRARSAMDLAQIIRDHPFTAVGIGLAAGLLLGLPRSGTPRRQIAALITAIAAQAARTAVAGYVGSRLGRGPADD